MRWTDEMVETATQMWGEGHSGADIAEALGSGLTRNAVIGKMHRLQASKGRAAPRAIVSEELVKASKRKEGRAPAYGVPAFAPAEPARVAPEPLQHPPAPSIVRWPEGVGLRHAGAMHCRAVKDERGPDGLAMFCGHVVHVRPNGTRSSWCIEHLRRVVDPQFFDQALTGRRASSTGRAA